MKMLKKSIYVLLPSLAFLTFRGKGGGGGGDSTQTTVQKMDPEVREKWLEMYGKADELAGEEYSPYQGENLAQFDPLQLQGFDRYENAVGTGYDTLGRALSTANTSAGYTPDTVNTRTMGSTFEDYLNPYTGEVIDTTMQDMERQRQMAMGDIAGSAQAANAFGGSRHGIAEAETNRGFADEMGQISAQLRDQGFNTAMQGFMGDSALMQQGDLANQAAGLDANQQAQSASSLLSALSGQERDQAFGDAQMLSDVGSEKRAMAQSELDLEYAKFLEEQQHPLRQLEIVQGAFGLTPQITSTKGVTRDDSSKPDLWQNLADTFSDVRLKDNITKLNGYAYNFKSRPETITGGVMAQEVELIAPHLVNTDVETGYKRVNYEALVGVLLEAVKDLKSEVEGLKRG